MLSLLAGVIKCSCTYFNNHDRRSLNPPSPRRSRFSRNPRPRTSVPTRMHQNHTLDYDIPRLIFLVEKKWKPEHCSNISTMLFLFTWFATAAVFPSRMYFLRFFTVRRSSMLFINPALTSWLATASCVLLRVLPPSLSPLLLFHNR